MRFLVPEILDRRIRQEAASLAARFGGRPASANAPCDLVDALLATDQPASIAGFTVNDLPPTWCIVVAHFGLQQAETFALVAAAAPDLDPRYASLYALLQDDATMNWFSAHLGLRLGGADVQRAAAADGRLCRERLMIPVQEAGAARCRDRNGLRVHPYLASFLRDEPLPADITIVSQNEVLSERNALADLDVVMATPSARPIVLMSGTDRIGQREAIRDLLARLGRGLVIATMPQAGKTWSADALADLVMLARLHRAGLLLVTEAGAAHGDVARLAHGHVPVFVSAPDEAAWLTAFGADTASLVIRDSEHCRETRVHRWREALASAGLDAQQADLDRVARRHRLGPAEIGRAVRSLSLQAMRGQAEPVVDGEALMDAAGQINRAAFGPLATRLDRNADWDSLVLPLVTHDSLRDFAGAMANSARIFEDWGFAGVGRGRRGGVTALFTGPSGTGKTMAAGIISRHAGYEIWRIDLSGLVSKYIGETEKNLERVFNAARASDVAILFDEADAIFGTRSEVKDAHDRYANIETAYLLQRLEDHDGPVILASNIAANIDQAFLRRLDFVIEFPIPDASLRAEIWRRSLPSEAPLGDDIDIPFLARQFTFTGGDIRSVTLDAAFRAARLEIAIDMALLLRSVSRQLAKHGRVPALAEFGRYRALMDQPLAREAAE
jgi:hypothetical protein